MWGLPWIRPITKMEKLAEELTLIWEASEAEEWINANLINSCAE